MSDIKIFLENSTKRVEDFISQFLEDNFKETGKLYEAMQYGVFNGGKRLRPALVYATGESFAELPQTLDARAAAVELIHCYSLLHDDLPAMDNDDIRRGKPTCHKVFGEALAILAGDALQAAAFHILSSDRYNPVPASKQIQMIQCLNEASGPMGMIGGQVLDILNEGQTPTFDTLLSIHQKKTGALIRASVLLGAMECEIPLKDYQELKTFAEHLGLCFQIQDDILDVEGTELHLGKTPGKDKKQTKITFPALLGMEKTKAYLNALYKRAIESLAGVCSLSNENNLSKLTAFIRERTH